MPRPSFRIQDPQLRDLLQFVLARATELQRRHYTAVIRRADQAVTQVKAAEQPQQDRESGEGGDTDHGDEQQSRPSQHQQQQRQPQQGRGGRNT